MLLGRCIQNFRKLAQLEKPKNRGELNNDVNVVKSKIGKMAKIQEISLNSKNPKLVF